MQDIEGACFLYKVIRLIKINSPYLIFQTFMFWLLKLLKRYFGPCQTYIMKLLTIFAMKLHRRWVSSNRPEVLYKISIHRSFAKFTGKHLWWSHIFNSFYAFNFIKKWHEELDIFHWHFARFLRTHSKNHLNVTASVASRSILLLSLGSSVS